MADNVFAGTLEEPFCVRDEWFPLLADNDNAPPGVDLPSFAACRGVSVAVMFFIIRRSRAVPAARIDTPVSKEDPEAAGRRTLLQRAQHWILSDPA